MNNNHRERNFSQRGFTLIELLIVLVILGILFAFAIRSYQKYVARTQVARVVLESGNLKTAVETCINDGFLEIGKASEDKCDTNASLSGLIVGDSQGDSMNLPNMGVPQAQINALTGEATIVATFGNGASSAITGDTVTWTRDINGSWACLTTVETKYGTAGCELF